MTLALPAALWGLLALPVLVLLRILARRPRLVVVPSLIPWRAAAAAEPPAQSRKALLDWPLVLQMLAVGAAALGAAGPRLERGLGGGGMTRAAALVLDNSASMGARSADGTARLDRARARLEAEIAALRLGAGTLTITSPEPRVLTAGCVPAEDLKAALRAVGPAPAGGDLAGAVAAARAAAGRAELVVVASDDLSPLDGLPLENVIALRVGEPARNLGIVAAAVEDGKVFAAVRNASAASEKLRLELLSGGEVLGSREAELAAGERRGFAFPAPAGVAGFVELRLSEDDLPADNRVEIGLRPPPRPVFIGKAAPSMARALSALGFPEGQSVGAGAPLPAGARLVVVCDAEPPRAETGSFTLVISPPGPAAGPARAALEAGAPEFFPRTGGYSFAIPETRRLAPAPGDRVLLGSAEQPLVALAADGSRCRLAFEPDATEWVKHPSFPVFCARLAERVPLLAEMLTSVRPNGLLDENETACRVAGREVRRVTADPAAAPGRGAELAPWLFALAALLLAVELLVALRKP